MGSVLLASWYSAVSGPQDRLSSSTAKGQQAGKTLKIYTNRNFSDVSITGVLQYSGLFLFIEGTQVVGAALPSVT
jgi:hypothetical protein